MKKLTLMKRITDLRDDFIEEAYLPEAVPVLPVKPRRTIPVLGIPFAMAGKIAAASLAGIAVIGVVLGIAIPALKDMEPTMEETPAISDVPSDKDDTDDPYEDTDPSFHDELKITVTPKIARPGETVEILIEGSSGSAAAEGYRVYFTYATTPVGADLLAYTAEPTGNPALYMVIIPQNAPVGQYDLHIEWGDREQILEKPFFCNYAEGYGNNNENVWFTSMQGSVYPVAYENGGRYVMANLDEMDDIPWIYTYADGLLYMDTSYRDLDSLPTLIWNNKVKPYYSDRVQDDRTIAVYDEQGNYIKRLPPESIYTLDQELERGIYYLSMKGDLQGIDHTEEIKEIATAKDSVWGDHYTISQDLFWEEYGKDRQTFVDKHYCEHLLRVIIP